MISKILMVLLYVNKMKDGLKKEVASRISRFFCPWDLACPVRNMRKAAIAQLFVCRSSL